MILLDTDFVSLLEWCGPQAEKIVTRLRLVEPGQRPATTIINKELLDSAIKTFYRLREIRGIEKKPATRELINWIRA